VKKLMMISDYVISSKVDAGHCTVEFEPVEEEVREFGGVAVLTAVNVENSTEVQVYLVLEDLEKIIRWCAELHPDIKEVDIVRKVEPNVFDSASDALRLSLGIPTKGLW